MEIIKIGKQYKPKFVKGVSMDSPFENVGGNFILKRPIQSSDFVNGKSGIKIDPTGKTSKVLLFGEASKNRIFAQNSAPVMPGEYYQEGDLWFDSDNNNTIYRANSALAWVSVKDGTIAGKITTFYQTSIPTSLAAGDLWFDTNDNNKPYRATNAGDDQIVAGEWVAVQDGTIAVAATTANWSGVADDDGNKPEANADVTADNTANDTSNVNSSPATLVQDRAEALWNKQIVVGGGFNDYTLTAVANTTITAMITQTLFDYTGAGANGSARMVSGRLAVRQSDITSGIQYGDVVILKFTINLKLIDTFSSNDVTAVFIGFGVDVDIASAIVDRTYTNAHIGFLIARTGGATKLYATNASGTTQTITEIATGNYTNFSQFRIEYTSANIKFYLDGILVATHTTNLPTTAEIFVNVGYYSYQGELDGIVFSNNYITEFTI